MYRANRKIALEKYPILSYFKLAISFLIKKSLTFQEKQAIY